MNGDSLMFISATSPTQDTSAGHSLHNPRCEHGYYVEARTMKTPRCPACDPIPEPWTPDEVKSLLRRRAMSQIGKRTRAITGRFERLFPVPDGHQRCWRCKDVHPLDHEHFRHDKGKPSGFQTRCKKCDNGLKTSKRREFAGVET